MPHALSPIRPTINSLLPLLPLSSTLFCILTFRSSLLVVSLTLMAQTMQSRAFPSREDCWSEEATWSLVHAWGRRYMELNRGNLRQKDWQDVADSVNALHLDTRKTCRTDIQCKNRVDTIKKRYKIEKAKIIDSNGTYMSSWPFFSRLDELIGSNYNTFQKVSPSGSNSNLVPSRSNSNLVPSRSNSNLVPSGSNSMALGPNSPPMAVPLPCRKLPLPSSLPPGPAIMPPQIKLQPVVLTQKWPFSATEGSSLRINYSVVAAAAATAATDTVVEEEGEESSEEMENDAENEATGAEEEGMRSLAKAIERFGEIYERVEEMKQRQVVELERQRMQFLKELEVQRMQLFMDTQVQLEKIKQAKRSGSNDSYS